MAAAVLDAGYAQLLYLPIIPHWGHLGCAAFHT